MKEKILESFRLNGKGMIIMIASALCTALGQLFWKLSGTNSSNLLILLVGFVMYALGACLMIIAFRFGRFSVLHPMMCLSYVFAIVFGVSFLNEAVSIMKAMGVGAIIFGVVLLGGGDH